MTSVDLEKTAMTEEEVEKLWEAFKMFDADGSGGVSAEELGQVMHSLGQSPTETELRDMIKEVDVDLSGTIDFEEFKVLMLSQQGDRKSRLKLAFSVFDEDGSGQITADEMRNVMSQFGLTEKELDEIVHEVDHDGDASIDFEEEAVVSGNFLQDTYYFDPTLMDKTPYFTPEEEEFARSGVFVEIA